MDLNLRGRRAIVTGASKGIGRGVASTLAAEGCDLVLAARDGEALLMLAERLRLAHGVAVDTLAIDLAERGAPARLAARAGAVDILVNNAGAIPAGDLLAVDEQAWRASWDLKVFGYIDLARAVYAGMCERRRGVILNITGLAAERHDHHYIAGTTANAALNAFSRALGSFSVEQGVRVLAVCPGLVETDRLVGLMQSAQRRRGRDADAWREALADAPRGRAATVQEVADVVAFAASDRAAQLSGSVITVDAGAGARHGNFAPTQRQH